MLMTLCVLVCTHEMCVHTYVRVCVHVCVYTCEHVCVHECTCICMCTCVHANVYSQHHTVYLILPNYNYLL